MPVHKAQLKQIATLTGKILGVAGLLFVLYKLTQEYTLTSFLEQFKQIWNTLPLLLIVNLASMLLGIFAWQLMLHNYATEPFNYKTAYYYFSKTEIAKYLPGNMFHFLGRQALAPSIGISQKGMAKVSLFLSFLLLTSTIFTSTFFAFFANHIPLFILTLMGVSCIIAAIAVHYTYPSFPVREKIRINLLLSVSITMQGFMLGIIVATLSSEMDLALFFECVSIYIISWLIGFVTPGASGGLGIREGTFIAIAAFLQVDIPSDIIVFSVLLVRFVNILTDMLMYLSTLLMKSNIKGLEE